jgi:hypothetical protein
LSATSWYGVYALFTLPLAIVAPFVAQWFGIRQVLEQRRETRIWIAVTVVPWLVVSVLVVAVATGLNPWDQTRPKGWWRTRSPRYTGPEPEGALP